MSPHAYAQHDMLKLFLNLVKMQVSMTAAQMQGVLFFMQPWVNAAKVAEQAAPVRMTMQNFNQLARWNPVLAAFIDRLPEHMTIQFGATDEVNEDNLPLISTDNNHIVLHLSWSRPDKNLEALAELINLETREYGKPDWRIEGVEPVTVLERDFVDLVHFQTDPAREDAPKILLGAPMSGHYSTLIRDKIQHYLDEGLDVYVVDINNTRDIPADKGEMGLNGLVDRYVDFLEYLGSDTHVEAICQATVPALIASAWLADNKSELQPASLTLVSGPVDPHIAPTEVTEIAREKGIGFFENLVSIVPDWYIGKGREVLPGFIQLFSFRAMNPGLHAGSYARIFNHLVVGDDESVEKNREFYREYNAVADLDASYDMQTIQRIFIENQLTGGTYEYRGQVLT